MFATVYSNNDLHFVNKDVRELFKKHEVVHYIDFITSSSFTKLLEWAVQEMIEYLWIRSMKKENTFNWNANVKDEMFFMNTKSVRIYEYFFLKLMLRYESQKLYFDIKLITQSISKSKEVQSMKIKKASTHQRQIYLALRSERRQMIRELMFYVVYHHFKRNRVQRLLKKRNLMIVWHHVVDNQRGRKLESRWLESRLLISLTSSENSRHMQQLHEDETIKRYHLNDILLYKERENFLKKEIIFESNLRETRSMIINERRSENSRARAVLLSIYLY